LDRPIVNCGVYFKGGNVGIGTVAPTVPLHIGKEFVGTTDVPMQRWDVLTAGYSLTLSNYNSAQGVDYRFTSLDNSVSSPVFNF